MSCCYCCCAFVNFRCFWWWNKDGRKNLLYLSTLHVALKMSERTAICLFKCCLSKRNHFAVLLSIFLHRPKAKGPCLKICSLARSQAVKVLRHPTRGAFVVHTYMSRIISIFTNIWDLFARKKLVMPLPVHSEHLHNIEVKVNFHTKLSLLLIFACYTTPCVNMLSYLREYLHDFVVITIIK